jgi:hypothetical protein
MRKPNLFIVGAPRCGTSALHDFLGQHPDIFMSDPKELNYFGTDLPMGFRPELVQDEYLSVFTTARDERYVGESSVKYLSSVRAAREIREFDPSSRIIIMLRNPVDMMHSLHNHFFQWNFEDIADFASAVAADPDRREGRRLPSNRVIPAALLCYRHMASFADQVERYLDALGPDQVHVILFEDFRTDAAGAYRSTLEALGVRPDFEAEMRFINSNRETRSQFIKKLTLSPRLAVWLETYKHSRYVGFVCRQVRAKLDALKLWNSRENTRRPMDPEVRRTLTAEFAPEVERLGRLIGKDLSHWSRPA